MATKSLYVGNIPHGASEQELRDLFNDYGPVGDVRIIEGKGFAFVDLPAENVPDAIAALNGQDFNGRALRIDEARPRRERTGGGGGGRRFGGGDGGGGFGGGGGGGYGGGGGRRGGGGRGRDRDRDW